MNSGIVAGIIGGFGGMGRLFSGVFERAGFEVICSGRNTPIKNEDIAAMSDIVIVSVPIHETVRVIEEIAPVMTNEQLLCDFTSVKKAPVDAMLKSSAKVIGLHPMFGPSVSGIKGQTIIASPKRCDEKTKEMLFSIFRDEGAAICEMEPEEHDKVMSVVQGLVHFTTLSIAETIRNTQIPLETLIPVMSPVYRMEMGLIGRILGQDASLYADILQMNPENEKTICSFSESVEKLREIVMSKDKEKFGEFFSKNTKAFESYIPRATEDTDLLIEAMVKRK